MNGEWSLSVDLFLAKARWSSAHNTSGQRFNHGSRKVPEECPPPPHVINGIPGCREKPPALAKPLTTMSPRNDTSSMGCQAHAKTKSPSPKPPDPWPKTKTLTNMAISKQIPKRSESPSAQNLKNYLRNVEWRRFLSEHKTPNSKTNSQSERSRLS